MNTFKKPRWLIRESNVTNEDLYFNRREFIKKSSIYLGSSAIAYSYLSKYGTAAAAGSSTRGVEKVCGIVVTAQGASREIASRDEASEARAREEKRRGERERD